MMTAALTALSKREFGAFSTVLTGEEFRLLKLSHGVDERKMKLQGAATKLGWRTAHAKRIRNAALAKLQTHNADLYERLTQCGVNRHRK